MTELKEGDIVNIKSSDERAFVLEVFENNELLIGKNAGPSFSGKFARLHVPVIGEEGIRHEVRTFMIEELETYLERFDRIYDAEEDIKKRTREKRQLEVVLEHKEAVKDEGLTGKINPRKLN